MSSARLLLCAKASERNEIIVENYFAMKWKTLSMENNFFCAIVIGKLQIIPYRLGLNMQPKPEKTSRVD
jgi:hypothetical protein